MGSKGSNTTTTSSSPPAWVNQAYQDIYGRASNVAQTPYTAYTGQQVAGFSPDQQTAFGNVNAAQGMAQSYIDQGMDYTAMGAAPVANMTGADIEQYRNPFQSMVTDATMANINETNNQQMQHLQGNATLQGALGGDRMGVAKAELARQQNLSNNQTLANLSSSGFDKAAQLAGNQQLMQQQNAARAGQAAYSAGSLGSQAQGAALQGANAQLTTGGQQQQLSQAQLNAAYGQWMEQQGFPYQQTNWLAGIASGLGSGAGGTSSTTAPAPNPLGQYAGVAATAAGAYFSDENLKDDIEHVGSLFDGQPVYRYRYKGDPRTQLGLMAQDVEQSEPDAVGQSGGFKTVDYGAATDEAAVRGSFATGGAPSMPWSGAGGFIPQAQITRGSGPPKPPGGSQDKAANMMDRAASMASGLRNKMGGGEEDFYGGSPETNPNLMPIGEGFSGDLGGMYQRGGLVPGFAGGGAPDYEVVPSDEYNFLDAASDDGEFGVPLPPPRPVAQGGMFGGMPGWSPNERPLGWDDQAPPAPQPTQVADNSLPPQITGPRPPPGTQAMKYADDALDPPPDDSTEDSYVPPAPVSPGLERPPADIASTEPSDLNPQGGVATPGKKSSGINWRGPMSDDWKPNMPLIAAGLGMLSSRSPNLGNVIGDGGQAGVGQYMADKKMEVAQADKAENRVVKREEMKLRLKQLQDSAKHHAEQMRIAGERNENTRKYQEGTLAQRKEAEARRAGEGRFTPQSGEAIETDDSGNSVRVPGMVPFDTKTGKIGEFNKNVVLTPKGGVKPPPSSTVERAADALQDANPGMPRDEAIRQSSANLAKPRAAPSSPLERVAKEIDDEHFAATGERIPREALMKRAAAAIAKPGNPPQGKPLPETIRKSLDTAATSYEKVNNYIQTYNPSYSGMKWKPAGEAANLAGQYLGAGGKNNIEAADWWANYANHRNEVRKSLFGSALTQTEKVEFDKADINRAMTTDAIEKNLKRQQYWAHRAMQKTAGARVKEGIYSQDAIKEAIGGIDLADIPHPDEINVKKPEKAGAAPAAAPAAPAAAPAVSPKPDAPVPVIKSKAEYDALPSGPFIMNGKQYTK